MAAIAKVDIPNGASKPAQTGECPGPRVRYATGNAATYFAPDRRNVTDAAVDHVMWSFYRNYCGEELSAMQPVARDERAFSFEGKPCDEDLLLAHLERDRSA